MAVQIAGVPLSLLQPVGTVETNISFGSGAFATIRWAGGESATSATRTVQANWDDIMKEAQAFPTLFNADAGIEIIVPEVGAASAEPEASTNAHVESKEAQFSISSHSKQGPPKELKSLIDFLLYFNAHTKFERILAWYYNIGRKSSSEIKNEITPDHAEFEASLLEALGYEILAVAHKDHPERLDGEKPYGMLIGALKWWIDRELFTPSAFQAEMAVIQLELIVVCERKYWMNLLCDLLVTEGWLLGRRP